MYEYIYKMDDVEDDTDCNRAIVSVKIYRNEMQGWPGHHYLEERKGSQDSQSGGALNLGIVWKETFSLVSLVSLVKFVLSSLFEV